MQHTRKFIVCQRCDGQGKLPNPAFEGAARRARRVHAGKTLTEVAALMGITKGYLSDLELGRRAWIKKQVDEYERAVAR